MNKLMSKVPALVPTVHETVSETKTEIGNSRNKFEQVLTSKTVQELLFAVLIMICPGIENQANAETFFLLEGDAIAEDFQGTKPTVSNKEILYFQQKLSDQFGFSSTVIMTPHWSEIYAGPTYSPIPELTLSASIGLEQADNPLRIAGSVDLSLEKFSFSHISEFGGSGYWQKTTGSYNLADSLNIGVNWQTGLGVGPKVEYTVPETNLKIMLNPIYNFETKTWGIQFGSSVFFMAK